MTWVKLDDQFFSHPKVVALSDGALHLWFAGLCHSGSHLTDGFISRSVVVSFRVRSCRQRVTELIESGLWSVVDDGWQIHNYEDWQKTKKQVEAERDSARRRQQKRRSHRDSAVTSHRDNPVDDEPGHTVTHAEVTQPDTDTDTENSSLSPLAPELSTPKVGERERGPRTTTALTRLSADRLAGANGVNHPTAWRRAVESKAWDDHRLALIAAETRGASVDELAQIAGTEPSPVDGTAAATTATMRRQANPVCPDCRDTHFVLDDQGDAVACRCQS